MIWNYSRTLGSSRERMKLLLRNRALPAMLAIGLAIFLACAVWGFGVNASNRNVSPGALAVKPPSGATLTRRSPAPAAVQASDDTQVTLVTLTPRGFDPTEVIISQKRFVLAIDNLSQLNAVSIRFSQATGNPAAPLAVLQQMQMARTRVNANTFYELSPGEYWLTEDGHPNWRCKFTVQ